MTSIFHQNDGNKSDSDNVEAASDHCAKASWNSSSSTASSSTHHHHEGEPNSPNNDSHSNHHGATMITASELANKYSKIIATPIAERRNVIGSGDNNIVNDHDHDNDSNHFVTPNPRVSVTTASRVLLDKHPHRDEIESLLELSASGSNCCAISQETPKKPPPAVAMNANSLSSSHENYQTNKESIKYSTPPFTTTIANNISKQQSNLTWSSTTTANHHGNMPEDEKNSCRTIHPNNNSHNNNPKRHYLQTIATLQRIRKQLQQETATAKNELRYAQQQLQQANKNRKKNHHPTSASSNHQE